MSSQFCPQRTPNSERIFQHCFCKNGFLSQLVSYQIPLFFFLSFSLSLSHTHTHTNKKQIFDTHMRMLRDNPSDKNSVQNLFTEVNELKSTSNSTISACGLSF